MTGASVHSKAAEKRALEAVQAEHKAALDSGAIPPHPGPGITGIFGKVGSGKTLLQNGYLSILHRKGVQVIATPTAGLRFAEAVELEDLYALAMNIAIVFSRLTSFKAT